MAAPTPSRGVIGLFASTYICSGICQPLIMNLCKNSGLADPTAQLYMLFYYLGPSTLVWTLLHDHCRKEREGTAHNNATLPTKRATLLACGIATFDIVAQSMNYTGAGMAGSSIFAVIYSAVTIWTALWSRLLLGRSLSWIQWLAVWLVFGGLAMTATQSMQLGENVLTGAMLVVLGSAMHGATYVLSEAIMNHGDPSDRLTVRQNTAIQAVLASTALGLWQLVYTLPRWDWLIGEPARLAGTTVFSAGAILLGFAFANLVHAVSFFHTLKHYPGGATSAGVMKGLQAVLVFVATDWLFCGRVGGDEMCFIAQKLISLFTVVSGVSLFGVATEFRHASAAKRGYSQIGSTGVDTSDELETMAA